MQCLYWQPNAGACLHTSNCLAATRGSCQSAKPLGQKHDPPFLTDLVMRGPIPLYARSTCSTHLECNALEQYTPVFVLLPPRLLRPRPEGSPRSECLPSASACGACLLHVKPGSAPSDSARCWNSGGTLPPRHSVMRAALLRFKACCGECMIAKKLPWQIAHPKQCSTHR